MSPRTKPPALGLALLVLTCLCGGSGCANRPDNPWTDDILYFVPGVAGDGRDYDGLIRGLRAGGAKQHLEVLTWGAPGPLFILNFQTDSIHRDAEAKLAQAMKQWRSLHPTARIDVIAHSAGCGVTLGALATDASPMAHTIVLLNPSVSPGYPLAPSLAKVEDRLHVFHSDKDTVFLDWRTSTFGTYDNVKTKAAGNRGFDLSKLPPDLRERVVQHPREDWWPRQDNDGSHFGTTAEEFAKATLAPLLRHE